MATLRQRVVEEIISNPGVRYTNWELARVLQAPMASVRRATLNAMLKSEIEDGGPASYNASVVTYVAPLEAEIYG